MSLTKPNQQLRRDLKEAAALLKWAGGGLVCRFQANDGWRRRARRHGADEIAMSLQETEDKVAGYANEVQAGQISRTAEKRK
ncbi:hypothetical protein [Pseudomonas sp.]|uniref:hypothetical protein n=1 Tax=Pseudomonas sp. TaxID=306 RepID=UPI0028A8F730|nr:hypothetical protein [Pseudomonas sp.]